MNKQNESNIGIASFVTSVVSGLFIFMIFVLATVMQAEGYDMDGDSAIEIVLVIALYFFIGATLVAHGLGITGLFQKDRNKIYAILGTVFSAILLIATTFIMLLGWVSN